MAGLVLDSSGRGERGTVPSLSSESARPIPFEDLMRCAFLYVPQFWS